MRGRHRGGRLPGLSAAQRLREATGLGSTPGAAHAAGRPTGLPADPLQVPRPSPAQDGDLERVLAAPAPERADGAAPSTTLRRGAGAPDPYAEPEAGSDDEAPLALVRRAQAGDAEAFGELYDRYLPMVYRYVSYRVGSMALAEDLTSETFARALHRLDSYSWQGRDIGAWFVTIARNLVADHYKSGRYRLELTTSDVGAAAPGLVSDGPEGEVLAGLRTAALLDAVRQLGDDQQECIALRFLQGLSVSETATVMGRNEGAVRALQGRAVRRLGRLLSDELEP